MANPSLQPTCYGLWPPRAVELKRYAQVDDEVARIVKAAALRLAELGARVEERDPGFEDQGPVFATHWFSGAAYLLRNFTPEQKATMDQGLLEVAAQGAKITMLETIDAAQKRGALGVRMNLFHQDYACW